ncbi:hypothetical protein CACET_c33990 [Clostridium aceticum]|uniref:Uncharacterized protein n=1 Tax=Clostridium aceticum TaxID=84022 RepID=A0A0D8IC83_9CLOT|nr:sigma-54-dependent Fis family transcriptional regulator [Clostridium aceticum]AKL96842.1 hypothetical protein CACET_c33990 [Clostridium aceticum]KJF27587.1 hypothetical protein TZ02_07335 [Clostridium aceticum]
MNENSLDIKELQSMVEDLTRKNQELIEENQQLKFKINLMDNILDNMCEAVHAVDKEGKVIVYSRSSEKYSHWTKEEAIGQHESDLWKQPTNFKLDKNEIIRTRKPIKNVEMIGNSSTGNQFHVIAGFYPYFEEGEYKAFYYTGKDITSLDFFVKEPLELQNYTGEDDGVKNLNNGTKYTLEDIIGNSVSIQECKNKARKIANYNSNILLYGETGTGKELFAQGIHNEGFYTFEPFIAFNCSAVPETLIESLLFGTVKGAFTGAENTIGLFEQVGKGTLFLDEINSMPLTMQAKLLRVLQEKKIRRIGGNKDIDIECCVISATNIDPQEAVKKNILREDLYYRIATVVLNIPSLKERKEDIPILISYFIKALNKKLRKHIKGVDPKVLDYLGAYHWPGNVRELLNILECAVMFSDQHQVTLTPELFPPYIFYSKNKMDFEKIDRPKEVFTTHEDHAKDLRTLLDAYEKKLILNAINDSEKNISMAAKNLGIDRKSLYRKIEKLNIEY